MSNWQTVWLILFDYLLIKLRSFLSAYAHLRPTIYTSIQPGQRGQSTANKNVSNNIVLLLHIFIFHTIYAKNH